MQLVWTDAGLAKLLNAENTGTDAVRCSHIAVGRGTTPAQPTDTALENEIQRLDTISGRAVDDHWIHVVYRDETNAAYPVYEVALIADDGTMLARYAQADAILEKAAGSTGLLQIDAPLVDVTTAAITFPSVEFNNPPWSETVFGVLRRATTAIAQAGTDNTRGMTAKLVFAAIKSYFGGATGAGHGKGLNADTVDGIEGGKLLRRDQSGVVDAGNNAGPFGVRRSDASSTNISIGFEVSPANAATSIVRYLGFADGSLRVNDDQGMANGAKVWNGDQQGPDSGMDADTVDGAHRRDLVEIAKTGLGRPGNAVTTTLNDASEVADLPAGWSGFVTANDFIPDSGNGCFFFKLAGRNADRGWSALVISRQNPSSMYYGAASSDASDIVWTKLWSDRNMGPDSGLDADTLHGLPRAEFVEIGKTHLGSTNNASRDSFETWPAVAALPVGYSGFVTAAPLFPGAAPYGYFTKLANRDAAGGWSALYVERGPDKRVWVGESSSAGGTPSWYRLWAENDTVGEVSTDANGRPTGALFQRLENADGSATRSADGTMQCWHQITLDTNRADFLEGAWAFPAPFAGMPALNANIVDLSDYPGGYTGVSMVRVVPDSATGCRIRVYRADGAPPMDAPASASVIVTATGRWA